MLYLVDTLHKCAPFAALSQCLAPPPRRRTYFDVDALLDSVESGAIAPLKGRWLVQLHKDGGRLRRRQDLPPEALWSAAELRALAAALGDDFGVLFVALSYRWLSKDHPDPDGFHLKIVAEVAALYLNLVGPSYLGPDKYPSGLTAAFRAHGVETPPDFALFDRVAHESRAPPTRRRSSRGTASTSAGSEGVCWMRQAPEGFAFEPFVDEQTARRTPRRRTTTRAGACRGGDQRGDARGAAPRPRAAR